MKTALVIIAIVLFVLAAVGVTFGFPGLGWLGLALLAGALLVPGGTVSV